MGVQETARKAPDATSRRSPYPTDSSPTSGLTVVDVPRTYTGARPAPHGEMTPEESYARRRRAQLTVMAGLLVSFGGIVAYGLQAPIQPGAFSASAPWLAAGFVASWSGGILTGNSLVPPPPGFPSALRSQKELGMLATVAGALSAVVVAKQVGPWHEAGSSLPPELALASIGVVLAWVGGFLMGNSMRRFIRRRRRSAGRTAVAMDDPPALK